MKESYLGFTLLFLTLFLCLRYSSGRKPWDLNRCPVAWESRWWTRSCSIKRTDSRQFPIRRDTDADCSIRRDWTAPRRTWSPIPEHTLPEHTARSQSLMDSWRRRVAPDGWLAPARNFILIRVAATDVHLPKTEDMNIS